MSVRECEAGSVVEWSGSGSEREGLEAEAEAGLGGVLGRRCVDVDVDVGCCCVERGREGGPGSVSASEEDAWSREMASARRLRARGMVAGRWEVRGRSSGCSGLRYGEKIVHGRSTTCRLQALLCRSGSARRVLPRRVKWLYI